jgi:hypothetical protein
MALSGSIEIQGIEILNSYTNVSEFIFTKNQESYQIRYKYNIYVDKSYRDLNEPPLQQLHSNLTFQTTGSLEPFYWIYSHIRTQPYFISSSLIDC